MSFLLAFAAAALPTPAQATEIRCVALLAIVANEQARGVGWSEYPALAADGARFSGVVGEQLMTATGRTREQVRDLILASVTGLQKAKALPRAEVDGCVTLMRTRAPAPPPPALPRCAAIMGLAYDAVKARDGLTKDAKDLATLASVLAYRAKVELTAAGRSEAQAEIALGLERDAAAEAGGAPDAELRGCAALAQPE